jgi:hypothetical protein
MFALVESGSITKILSGNRGITIDGIQHPRAIFTVWTEAERNAIGIYTVEMDKSKLKSDEWYTNTDVTYTFGSGKVTGSYGDATAKAHADTLFTEQDKTDDLIPDGKDVGDVATRGLKYRLIQQVKKQAESELNKTDWYITRKAEKDTAIPSSITTHRDAVRTKQAEMETAITNASDTPALETLYTRNSENVRPIGDIPQLED